jgi:PilZ domain
MQKMGTVLKFPSQKSKSKSAKAEKSKGKGSANNTVDRVSSADASVVDMSERRDAMLVDERRKVKRTLLSEFIGASVVIPGKGLSRVNIYDISEGGLAFDIDASLGCFRVGEEISMRIYLNYQSYFVFDVKVTSGRLNADEAIYRHGVGFTKGTMNDVALQHFIKFMETVSANIKTDTGDILVSNIR